MKLSQYLEQWDSFDWRTANCAHFAAQWAGVDLSDLPMPAGKDQVRAILRADKTTSIKDSVTKRLGDPICPTLARVGDIVISGHTLGICNGRVFAAPADGRGIVFVPMAQAEAAWRVD